ncbi:MULTISPECIES: C10 family peptidase [unclassified Bacteroides]|uniref:C10 family peptidase n=1 Tax=unclassified Bacteroides TaxID=2646097 RepID=UPI000AE93A98|nr:MULTISPECIES: C10 family peptidase [unclassified Bacteroides]
MTKKIHLLMLLVIVTMFSCTSEELDFPQSEAFVEQSNENLITAEQASQYALDFVNKINKATRTSDFSLRVESVKAIGENKKSTRSGSASNSDSLFYIVNFADNNGYAIVSTDKNDTHVYGYVEQGTYDEDDTMDSGFSDYMSSIIASRKNMTSSSLASVGGNGGVLSAAESDQTQTEVMLPLLKCKWAQDYNKFCPISNEIIIVEGGGTEDCHCPTGCVPTAISQICSFLEYPESISYLDCGKTKKCKLNWNRINLVSSKTSTGEYISDEEVELQICHLMRYWGIQLGAEYKSTTQTSVASETAIPKIQELGDYDATPLEHFDSEKLVSDLKTHSKIIYVEGIERSNRGHAWVIDGYIKEYKQNKTDVYFHCNWGFKNIGNGYFLSTAFDTEKPVYDDDGKKITRAGFYFSRYSLKTSTITRPSYPSKPEITYQGERANSLDRSQQIFLTGVEYEVLASNDPKEHVLEYEWEVDRSGLDYKIKYYSEDKSRIGLTFKAPTSRPRKYLPSVGVRAKNVNGWGDYKHVRVQVSNDKDDVILQ